MKKKRLILIGAIVSSCFFLLILINEYKQVKYIEFSKFIEHNYNIEDEISEAIDIYLEEAIEDNNIEELAHSYMSIGSYFQSQNSLKKSNEYFLKSYKLAKTLNHNVIISNLCYKIGTNYIVIGDFVKAHKFAIESQLIEKKYKFIKRSPETLNLLGSIYEKTGLYTKSLATHFESLGLQKDKKNNKGIANSYHNLAHLYMFGERFDKAHTYYFKALDIYRELWTKTNDSTDIENNIVKIQIAIANYFINQNDSSLAIKYLNDALDISLATRHQQNIAQIFLNLGNVYYHWQNYPRAENYYIKSLKINKKENNKIGIVTSKINLGKIYFINNQIYKATENFKSSLIVASEINANRQIAEISNWLYRYYSDFPDSIKGVKKYFGIYSKSKDYLLNENTQDSIIEMSVKYEITAEKNKEISIEKYEKKIQTISLFLLLIIVIIVFVYFYFRNKAKQKAIYQKKLANEQIIRYKEVIKAIEEERKRITIDLHDSVGQMLSTTKLYFSGLEEIIENQDQHNKKLYVEGINLLNESSSELRNISYNIMPGTLIKYGLKSAIDELTNKISLGSKITFNFKSDGFNVKQDETSEVLIYRIIQESINNILKHSKASFVDIWLMKVSDKIIISIFDNGIGMEASKINESKGLGWKSIFSRVEILNGEIEINTAIDKGTRIDIIIPA